MFNFRNWKFDKNRMGIIANETLGKYGHVEISEIQLFRRPLSGALTSLMNVVSMGEFNQRIKNSEYDKLFHLGCFIRLTNGKVIEVDKHEVVKIREFVKNKLNDKNETMDVNVNKKIAFGQLIENTIRQMGEDKFYSYNGRYNNCQDFMLYLLNANGLGTSENNKFIKQNVEFLFKRQGFLEGMVNAYTNTLGSFERTYMGGSIKLHTGRTYTNELEEIGKRTGIEITMIMRDETEKLQGDGFYLVNLDDSDGKGTHWTGLIINKSNAYYCDSYGILPPQELYEYLTENYKTVYYNSTQYQENSSKACGLFVMAFLIFMKNNEYKISKFNKEFCKMFNYDKLKSNDQIVIKYIKTEI